MKNKHVPEIQSSLRHNIITMPEEIYSASGIIINGRRIKSLIFSTDLAIICNCNEHCRQDEDDEKHTDHGTPCHQHQRIAEHRLENEKDMVQP